jgi:hypothetical protein
MMPSLSLAATSGVVRLAKQGNGSSPGIGFTSQLAPSQEIWKNLNDIFEREIRETRHEMETFRQKLPIFDLVVQLSAGRMEV